MSRMFCTVKQAAETLHASEDQINALLERGILHEFRQGPHRLLREADVSALDLLRARGPQALVPAEPPVPAAPPSPRRSSRPKASRATQRRVQRGATAVARPPRPPRTSGSSDTPRTKKTGHRTANQTPGTEHRQGAGRASRSECRLPAEKTGPTRVNAVLQTVCPSYAAAVPASTELLAAPVVRPGGSRRTEVRPPAVVPPSACTPPAQTLGQWFWMGLVQDRPLTLALLSGLVLLALSALAAGICLTAGGF
jgi:hypothetical protein